MLIKLMKFHLLPALKWLWLTTFLASFILAMGVFYDFLAGFGIILIFYALIYHMLIITVSFQKNLRWNLMLPVKRWRLFFSYTISHITLFVSWFAYSFVYLLGLSIVTTLIKQNNLNVKFNYMDIGIVKDFILSMSSSFSVEFISLLVVFIIFFNFASMQSLNDRRVLSDHLFHRWSFRKKIYYIASLIAIGALLYPCINYSYFLVLSFFIVLGIVFFFYSSGYVLMLPKKSVLAYMMIGAVVGLALVFSIYKVALIQIKSSSSNLALSSFDFLGHLAPDVTQSKDGPSRIFIEYLINKNKQGGQFSTNMPLRLELLSLIDKFEMKDLAREIFNENLLFLFSRYQWTSEPENEDLVSTLKKINLKEAIKYNPYYVFTYIKYFFFARDQLEIFSFLDELKFYSSRDAIRFLLSMNNTKVPNDLIMKLIGDFMKKYEEVMKLKDPLQTSVLTNLSLKYTLGLYFLRYQDNKEAYAKIVKDRSSIMTLKSSSPLLAKLIKEIDINMKLYEASKKINGQSCNPIAPSLITGKNIPVDEELINFCYRYFFAKSSSYSNYILEEKGWLSLDVVKKSYRELRDPILDITYNK